MNETVTSRAPAASPPGRELDGSISLEVHDGIALLTVSGPRRNALTTAALEHLAESFRALSARSDVRVIAIRGANQTFISGVDISELADGGGAAPAAAVDSALTKLLRALAATPQPVVAIVEGAARGAGVAIAVASDLRLCGPDATFGIPAVKLGIAYPPLAVAQLANTIGTAQASWLLLTGAPLSSSEALDIGLVHRVEIDLRASADGLLASLAGHAPLSVRAAKLAIRAHVHDPSTAAAAAASKAAREAQTSDDLAEGARAFMEHRPPVFAGR